MTIQNVQNQRESSIELLRIISMLFIIFYHLLLCPSVCMGGVKNPILFKALEIPLHIGVILFILISGYYGIKPSIKGIIKFLSPIIIYTFLFGVLECVASDNVRLIPDRLFRSCLFISHTPFWFVRTYFFLYLVSPAINYITAKLNGKQRLVALIILAFIAVYNGTFRNDISLFEGKNLVNFVLIYLVGDTIRKYEYRWNIIPRSCLIIAWILLNGCIVILYTITGESMVGKAIFRLCFPYCSPILIVSSVLFFMFVVKKKFINTKINWIASSAFAIYLIHSSFIVYHNYLDEAVGFIVSQTTSDVYVLLFMSALTLVVFLASLFIDKLLTPFWKAISSIRVTNLKLSL